MEAGSDGHVVLTRRVGPAGAHAALGDAAGLLAPLHPIRHLREQRVELLARALRARSPVTVTVELRLRVVELGLVEDPRDDLRVELELVRVGGDGGEVAHERDSHVPRVVVPDVRADDPDAGERIAARAGVAGEPPFVQDHVAGRLFAHQELVAGIPPPVVLAHRVVVEHPLHVFVAGAEAACGMVHGHELRRVVLRRPVQNRAAPSPAVLAVEDVRGVVVGVRVGGHVREVRHRRVVAAGDALCHLARTRPVVSDRQVLAGDAGAPLLAQSDSEVHAAQLFGVGTLVRRSVGVARVRVAVGSAAGVRVVGVRLGVLGAVTDARVPAARRTVLGPHVGVVVARGQQDRCRYSSSHESLQLLLVCLSIRSLAERRRVCNAGTNLYSRGYVQFTALREVLAVS